MSVDEFFRWVQNPRERRKKRERETQLHVAPILKRMGDLGTVPIPAPENKPAVRYIAPGVTGRDLMATGEKPEPAVGQRWYSPEGVGHIIESIHGDMLTMSRAVPGARHMHGKVGVEMLKRKWIFGGQGVIRG